MNTPKAPAYRISAQNLGPIANLDAELTNGPRHLIFARNGTGKSFLSRAFRFLDAHGQGANIHKAPDALVSDEAPTGFAEFAFNRGKDRLGALELNKVSGHVTPYTSGIIFHVFSDEFVQSELRERQYSPDSSIDRVILIGEANITIDTIERDISTILEEEKKLRFELSSAYEEQKDKKLSREANIHGRLGKFRALSIESTIEKYPSKPEAPPRRFAEVIDDLRKLATLAEGAALPEAVSPMSSPLPDLAFIAQLLHRETSPARIAETLRSKIETHREFFRLGADIVSEQDHETCPFCEQTTSGDAEKEKIKAYITYFSDAESKHKDSLLNADRLMGEIYKKVSILQSALANQTLIFDNVKNYVPSIKGLELNSGLTIAEELQRDISLVRNAIAKKLVSLSQVTDIPQNTIIDKITHLQHICDNNNNSVNALLSAINNIDEERRALQNQACDLFEHEFVFTEWERIHKLRVLLEDARIKTIEVKALLSERPPEAARDRMAETFESMLHDFFHGRYLFDKQTFQITRSGRTMARGANQTLSDGEKSAIAFCYYIACIHTKVYANSDYEKIFLVIDDPVNSMSFDYVYSIVHCLRHLSISASGSVSTRLGTSSTNIPRAKYLILTHNNYFFNLLIGNRVLESGSTFALTMDGSQHKLNRLETFVAPFREQLRDVYLIANKICAPTHAIGNAIRSILEAVGRFCRPDKADLSAFVSYLASEREIGISSTLINSMSHGTFEEETPMPDDLIIACNEVLRVVEEFAPGQIEVIRREVSRRSGSPI